MNYQLPGPIPQIQGSAPLANSEEIPSARNKSVRQVLVVDDEQLLLWAIAETLRARGINVAEASNAREALRALTVEGSALEAVLLDLNLPDSHDLGLLRMVRRLAPAARVFLMTAFGSPEVRAEACQLGVVDVIDKPFDLTALDGLLPRAT
jgi:DNA-binding NtrC family response regulator